MNSKEYRLINRALQDKSLHPLFERGVNETWFAEESMRRVWTFVRTHFHTYGECPSEDVITSNFPSFQVSPVNDNIDYLMDEVQAAKRKLATNAMIREAIEHIEKHQDHERALQALQGGMLRLEEDGLNGSRDVDLTFEPIKRFDEYLELKNLPNGLRGYATGFPTIDKATSGLQKGQLITIVAPPKTGKSTLALQIATNVHLGGAVPMFQSFEMTNQEQLNRYDSMRARVSHTRLQTGSLTKEEEARYEAKLKTLENVEHQFWLGESNGDYTVSNIISKIQLLAPDVVFIDGVYLMIDEQSGEQGTPQAMTSITRSLKRVAQKYKVPIVISTQALTWKMKKGQVTADSVGYSSSFFQDSDVMFGLQHEDENVDDTRLLKVLASRNTGPAEVSLLWDWNTGQFREITSEDL
jgi:replicative DNA helicase